MSQYFRVSSMFSYWNVLVLNSFFYAFNYFILRCVPLCVYSLNSIYNHNCQNQENLTVYILTVLQVLKFGLHYHITSYHINLPWPLPLLFNHPLNSENIINQMGFCVILMLFCSSCAQRGVVAFHLHHHKLHYL